MQGVVKLYLLGLLLSWLSAVLGLLAFLGDRVPCLSGQGLEPEGSRLDSGHARGLSPGEM